MYQVRLGTISPDAKVAATSHPGYSQNPCDTCVTAMQAVTLKLIHKSIEGKLHARIGVQTSCVTATVATEHEHCRRRSRMQLLLPQEAAETAAQARDGDMLSKIQGMVGAASPLGLAVSQIKGRLQIPLRQ